MTEKEPIPQQEQGTSSDTFHSAECTTTEEAVELFNKARKRLLNVNDWEKLTGVASADFQLTDAEGKQVHREVNKGDHFKINIPGPGTITGGGYDWVQVEEISETNEEENAEVYIKVRPASSPENNDSSVAHFFDDTATSTFLLKRSENKVTASVHGRNEKPNTTASNIIDKARNALVSAGAVTAFSKMQWSKLVKGIIEG